MTNLQTTIYRVQAAREGGDVKRCHTQPTISHYDNAQHSYGAVTLLLLLHPNPSVNLIKAVMFHDVGERWMGDLPSPAKTVNAKLSRHYHVAENMVLDSLGMNLVLTAPEESWLKAVDTLDLWLWCRKEEAMGNRLLVQMKRNCENALIELNDEGLVPPLAWDYFEFAVQEPYERLSDFWTATD